jgi:hypothetical protein
MMSSALAGWTTCQRWASALKVFFLPDLMPTHAVYGIMPNSGPRLAHAKKQQTLTSRLHQASKKSRVSVCMCVCWFGGRVRLDWLPFCTPFPPLAPCDVGCSSLINTLSLSLFGRSPLFFLLRVIMCAHSELLVVHIYVCTADTRYK